MKHVLSRMLVASSLMIGASSLVPAFAADGPARPDVKRGASLYEQGDAARGIVSCASCHGPRGDSTIEANPKIAGQPAEYLRRQLVAFKAGADGAVGGRMSPIMSPMAQPLTEQDIADISLYVATQTLQNPAVATQPDLIELGQQIWRGGIASKSVPACAACHGADGAGIPAQYPYLSGQFGSYIKAQLEQFRAGLRLSNEPMHQIAVRLSDDEIRAVSDYAAGLR